MIHERFKRKYWKKTRVLHDSIEQILRFPMYFHNNLHPIFLMIRFHFADACHHHDHTDF